MSDDLEMKADLSCGLDRACVYAEIGRLQPRSRLRGCSTSFLMARSVILMRIPRSIVLLGSTDKQNKSQSNTSEYTGIRHWVTV